MNQTFPSDIARPEQTSIGVRQNLSMHYPRTINARIVVIVAGALGAGFLVGRIISLVSAAPSPPAIVTTIQPVQAPVSASNPAAFGFEPLHATITSPTSTPITKPLASPSLTLLNTYPVSMEVRAQIEPLYHEWENSHGEGASETQHFISLYASDAKINYRSRQRISIEEMRSLAIEARKAGAFTQVSDIAPIRWGQNSSGDQVEMVLYHGYGDDGGNWTSGERRLIWEKRTGKWQITRDDFPTSYIPSIQTRPVP